MTPTCATCGAESEHRSDLLCGAPLGGSAAIAQAREESGPDRTGAAGGAAASPATTHQGPRRRGRLAAILLVAVVGLLAAAAPCTTTYTDGRPMAEKEATLAQRWLSAKASAGEAVNVDLATMGLEGASSAPPSWRVSGGYASAASADYTDRAGRVVIRLIAFQYGTAEAMRRDFEAGGPYYEDEQRLKDDWCAKERPPYCVYRAFVGEPWFFILIAYQHNGKETIEGVLRVLSE